MILTYRPATLADMPALEALPPALRPPAPDFPLHAAQIEGAIGTVFRRRPAQLVRDRPACRGGRRPTAVGCGGWSGAEEPPSGRGRRPGPPRRSPLRGSRHRTGHDCRDRSSFAPPTPAAASKAAGSWNLSEAGATAAAGFHTIVEIVATLPGVPLSHTFHYTSIERFDLTLPQRRHDAGRAHAQIPG